MRCSRNLFIVLFILIISSFLVSALDITNLTSNNIPENSSLANLSTSVEIPDYMQGVLKLFFGVPVGENLEMTVTIVGVWIMLFLIILDFITFIPFFGKSVIAKFLGVFAIMWLIGIGGGARESAEFFYNFWSIFSFLKDWSVVKITLSLLVFIIAYIIINFIAKHLKESAEAESVEDAGTIIGVQVKMSKNKIDEMKKRVQD